MNIIIVDDDVTSLFLMEGFCSMLPYVRILGSFTNADEAYEFAKKNAPDVALLDIIMPVSNGLILCDRLRELYPNIQIFFTTSSPEYALTAFNKHALAYITKPYYFQQIHDAFERARVACLPENQHIYIRTFGHFDVFVDRQVLVFPRQKCKELLAYLVDRRGGSITMEQIIDVLWEDRAFDESVRAYSHVVMRDLKRVLIDAGIPELLVANRNQNAINASVAYCDYYRFLAGDLSTISYFNDEYMIDYSWAEPTAATLIQLKQNLSINC